MLYNYYFKNSFQKGEDGGPRPLGRKDYALDTFSLLSDVY